MTDSDMEEQPAIRRTAAIAGLAATGLIFSGQGLIQVGGGEPAFDAPTGDIVRFFATRSQTLFPLGNYLVILGLMARSAASDVTPATIWSAPAPRSFGVESQRSPRSRMTATSSAGRPSSPSRIAAAEFDSFPGCVLAQRWASSTRAPTAPARAPAGHSSPSVEVAAGEAPVHARSELGALPARRGRRSVMAAELDRHPPMTSTPPESACTWLPGLTITWPPLTWTS